MEQSIVCIIDLLGTKGIWSEENVERYFKTLERANIDFEKFKTHFKNLVGSKPLEFDFITFSDTIVITLTNKDRYDYFFDEHIEGFSQFIMGVFHTYFSDSFFARGAISFGDIEKRGNHFIGPAIDDAAEYFELPDMIGICFTPKASIAIDYAIDWNNKYFNRQIDKHIIKYKTPMKNKTELELYQINWAKYFKDPVPGVSKQLEPLAALSQFLSKRNIPTVAVSKFTNTIAFFKFVMGKN